MPPRQNFEKFDARAARACHLYARAHYATARSPTRAWAAKPRAQGRNLLHQGYVDALNKAIAGTPHADLSLQQTVIATAKQSDHVASSAMLRSCGTTVWQSPRPQSGGKPQPRPDLFCVR
jgi:hypothetical protein